MALCILKMMSSIGAQNVNGESPFFFALKKRRWGLLRLLTHPERGESGGHLNYTQTSEQIPSRKIISFLMKKARCVPREHSSLSHLRSSHSVSCSPNVLHLVICLRTKIRRHLILATILRDGPGGFLQLQTRTHLLHEINVLRTPLFFVDTF